MQRETIGLSTVIMGDCMDIMSELEGVGAIVTSPPYNMGKDLHTYKNGVRTSQNYAGFSDDMPEPEYQEQQRAFLEMCFDVCSGPLFYSHKDRIRNGALISPISWLSNTRWTLSQSVVLNKGSGANVDKRRFFPVHENIYILHKSPDQKLNNHMCLTSVWAAKQTNRKLVGHPATMPIAAATSCIQSTDAETILDPYLGSGTTLLACAALGRRGIGIEISQEYFDLSCARLSEQEHARNQQPELFATITKQR